MFPDLWIAGHMSQLTAITRDPETLLDPISLEHVVQRCLFFKTYTRERLSRAGVPRGGDRGLDGIPTPASREYASCAATASPR